MQATIVAICGLALLAVVHCHRRYGYRCDDCFTPFVKAGGCISPYTIEGDPCGVGVQLSLRNYAVGASERCISGRCRKDLYKEERCDLDTPLACSPDHHCDFLSDESSGIMGSGTTDLAECEITTTFADSSYNLVLDATGLLLASSGIMGATNIFAAVMLTAPTYTASSTNPNKFCLSFKYALDASTTLLAVQVPANEGVLTLNNILNAIADEHDAIIVKKSSSTATGLMVASAGFEAREEEHAIAFIVIPPASPAAALTTKITEIKIAEKITLGPCPCIDPVDPLCTPPV